MLDDALSVAGVLGLLFGLGGMRFGGFAVIVFFVCFVDLDCLLSVLRRADNLLADAAAAAAAAADDDVVVLALQCHGGLFHSQ